MCVLLFASNHFLEFRLARGFCLAFLFSVTIPTPGENILEILEQLVGHLVTHN